MLISFNKTPMTHRALTPHLPPLQTGRPAAPAQAPFRPCATDAPNPALTDLYRTYRAELVRFARIRIRHAADAEDLVQDAFLSAARAYPDRPATELKPLLFTMVRNLSINYLKSGDTQRRRRSDEIGEAEDRLACPKTPNPETQMSDAQSLDRVEAALAAMPARRRDALRLHRFEGLSYKQIAARLQVSPGTVKTDIAMAVAEIAETLARMARAGG